MAKLAKRITVNTKQCGGRPCVRGMRIRVVDVLELLAAALPAQVLKELPDLEPENTKACLRYELAPQSSGPGDLKIWLDALREAAAFAQKKEKVSDFSGAFGFQATDCR